jgi:lipoyl-dependent peroxiredoxin subunit D
MTLATAERIDTQTSIEALRDSLPDFAKDIRLNLSAVLKEDPGSGLSLSQVHTIALASAYATRHPAVIAAIEGETAAVLTPEAINASKAAATIMAMNNIYYRFVHLANDAEFGKMPVGLRMNVIANPGIPKADFELAALAVSALNGCGLCVESHVRAVEHAGVSKAGIQHAVKIAAVLNAAAQGLTIA